MQYPLFVEIDEALELARLALVELKRHEEEMARLRAVTRKPMRIEDCRIWKRREPKQSA